MGRDGVAPTYVVDDRDLSAEAFLALAQRVWPGRYDAERVRAALERTLNVTAWVDGRLGGCVRVLSDGYFFGTVPELFVDPDFRRGGIGSRLMELAWEASPTGLVVGAQPENEPFFERLGYERGLTLFRRRKPRPGREP